MRANLRSYLPVFAVALVAIACGGGGGGGKKTPANPNDVKSGGTSGGTGDSGTKTGAITGTPIRIAPKRKISKDAKKEFKKLVKRYKAASKQGSAALGKVCDELASAFKSLYDDAPKLVEAKFNEGAVLLECGMEKRAESVFRALLSKKANHGGAINNLGVIAWRRGNKGDAQDKFRKAAMLKNSGGYANLSMMARDAALRGDTKALKGAIDNIHRALAVDSSNYDAYQMLATLVYDHAKTKAQLEIARLIVVQALKSARGHAGLHNVLGLVLLKMEAVTRALKEFRKAVAIDNTLVAAHLNIGAITLSFRKYKAAAQAFQTVLDSSRATPKMKLDATVGLGVALRGQRKFKEALATYEKARKLPGAGGWIAYNIGILIQDYMFDAANPDAAIATLQKARSYFTQYSGKSRRRDVKRRLKNIKQMIPMLKEQKKMMAEMRKMQADQKKQDAAEKKKSK
jgi:tetratricopeptide (TPR) repeat protein